jgi:tetratricopeptide (TPR) repeat protein
VPFDQEWLFSMSLLAETSALVGDGESASMRYGLLLPWAQLNVADMSEGIRGSVSRYLAIVAAMMQRWEEAERHFEDAIAMNARMGARPWLAHTQSDYAQMLLDRDSPGDRERAQDLLEAALATYREVGMQRYAAQAYALTQEVRTTA